MAIVICPECSKQISQYAETCSNCGFTIKKYLKTHNLIDTTKEFICPKCAHTYAGYGDESDFIYLKCKYCNTPIVTTDITGDESLRQFLSYEKDDFYISLAKKYGNNQFSEEAYQHRLAMIKQENNASKEIEEQISPKPKCPTCNSTNIQKISSVKRTGSILGFGILSKNIGKTYECLNCKYKW